MKQFLFLISVLLVGCQKSDYELPLNPEKSTYKLTNVTKKESQSFTRDYLDQNFFVSNSKLDIKISGFTSDGKICLVPVLPELTVQAETTWYYQWDYIRTKNCGIKSCFEDKLIIKKQPYSFITLTVWAKRTGTNIKSDYITAQFK